MVIMSKKKAYVWFFRAQGEFLVLVMKEASISIFSLNVTSVWRRKKKYKRSFTVAFQHNEKLFELLFHVNFWKIKYFKQFLNWFSLKSVSTFKSSIWPRLLWQSTVSILICVKFGRAVPLIKNAISGKNSSFVIAAVFLYSQMLCCLAVSLQSDLRCSVQIS